MMDKRKPVRSRFTKELIELINMCLGEKNRTGAEMKISGTLEVYLLSLLNRIALMMGIEEPGKEHVRQNMREVFPILFLAFLTVISMYLAIIQIAG